MLARTSQNNATKVEVGDSISTADYLLSTAEISWRQMPPAYYIAYMHLKKLLFCLIIVY